MTWGEGLNIQMAAGAKPGRKAGAFSKGGLDVFAGAWAEGSVGCYSAVIPGAMTGRVAHKSVQEISGAVASRRGKSWKSSV